MKFKLILAALCLTASNIWASSNCEMFIQVLPPQGVSPEVGNLISTRLETALSATGSVASPFYGQFYMSAKCNDIYTEKIEGSPAQIAVHTELTLVVADVEGGTIFASKTLELRGVGSTEQRAYINAIKGINGKNAKLTGLVNEAKEHTISFFNKNYRTFLQKAQKAASMQDYEQALYYSTLIPECCTGYNEARTATAKYFQIYVDEEGAKMLRDAKAAFAISPNAEGAANAYAILAGISSQSASYKSALNFAEEIKRQTKAEYDFEVHQKYEDEVAMQRSIINAAREVGVAYGQGQKNNTTNILWK